MADNNNIVVELGRVPKERGVFNPSASPLAKYYKDNIVEYQGSAFIASPTASINDGNSGTQDNPEYYLTRVPFTTDPATPNLGWRVFANGRHTFSTGEDVGDVGIDAIPTASSNNLVNSGGVYSQISQLDQEVNGITITSWYQGNIKATTGKFNTTQTRVITKTVIDGGTKKVDIVCTGDVRINTIYRYKSGFDPINGGTLNTDFIAISSGAIQHMIVDADSVYPNIYACFGRLSDNTQNIDIDEVKANVKISYVDSVNNKLQILEQEADALQDAVDEIEEDVATIEIAIKPAIGDVSNITLKQGGYANGVPNTTSARIRVDRMILATELPLTVTVPYEDDIRIYGYNLYSTADDYTSFDSYSGVDSANYKKFVINSSLVGDAAGVTVTFCRASNNSASVTPDDAVGTTFKYSEGEIDKVPIMRQELNQLIGVGNADYYGSPIIIPITKRSQKMVSEQVLAHTPSTYSHTKYNQSMAAYGGKFFCFNDTSQNDGFCVVIDMTTKEVVDFIETIPAQLTSSHVNNACFTDVFYDTDDTYPLILISRGDYPDGTTKGKEMYVFRITENNGDFTFTHIKTISTEHYYFGSSWEYDANRRMIWGHLSEHGDWRWGNSGYRKFNNASLYFCPDVGTEYICIGTSENAAANAEITITFNGATTQTKTVNVQSGSPLSPEDTVIPYSPASYGYAKIAANQSANAFAGQYTVYSCDSNGQNRKAINYECVIGGFKAPSLIDSTTTTIADSEIQIVKIDSCTFQGGFCFDGKLFLPIQNYSTINGVVPSYTGHCCVVLEPESGVVESLIPTDTLENEGCAILDGVLYISSHKSNATENQDSFRIVKYTF